VSRVFRSQYLPRQPLPERSAWLRHHRICMTLLAFLKLEGLLDDVPTIGKVFRGCKLQRRSIDLG